MSSIATPSYTGYYQLSSASTGKGTTTNSAGTTTDLLLQALNGANTDTSTSADPAYTLNLSAAAKSYLSGSSSSSATGNSNFILSSSQQKSISDILAKYKDAPYTQDTFNQIQDDLKAAGLGADTLKLQDKAKNFNTTEVLIGYLNGNYTPTDNGTGTDAENTKASNYIQSVIKQWQSLSSTYADTLSIGSA